MGVTSDRFRDAMSRLAGGVVIVTTRDPAGNPRGMTATAVSSVSLDPPLVMACLDRAAGTHSALQAFGFYGLNFLGEGDAAVAARFGRSSELKFEGLTLRDGETGVPLLDQALAHCECAVERAVSAGDHTIFLGRVRATWVAEETETRPLVYYRGAYGTIERDSTPDRSS